MEYFLVKYAYINKFHNEERTFNTIVKAENIEDAFKVTKELKKDVYSVLEAIPVNDLFNSNYWFCFNSDGVWFAYNEFCYKSKAELLESLKCACDDGTKKGSERLGNGEYYYGKGDASIVRGDLLEKYMDSMNEFLENMSVDAN
jgi:predicted RNA-binding protein